MEFTLVPQLILVFSLVGILFILGRNFSKFKEVSKPVSSLFQEGNSYTPNSSQERNAVKEVTIRIKKEEEKFGYLCRRLAKRINWQTVREKYKQFSGFAHARLEKALKKARINFLKLDRKTVTLIEKARKKKEKHAADLLEEKDPSLLENSIPEEEKPEYINEEAEKVENGVFPVVDEKCDFAKVSMMENKTEDKKSEDKENKEYKGNKKEIKGVRKSKEKEYVEMIGEDPKNVDAYWKLGIIYSRKRNYKDALACFKQIVKIKPNYEKAKKKIKDISEKIRRK